MADKWQRETTPARVICFEKIWDNLSTFAAILLRIEDFWNFHHWKFQVANFRATFLNSPAGARGRAGWHMCGPGSAGPRGLILWLRSSLQIIADKTAPANISEEMPQCNSLLIYSESYITLSHMLGPQPKQRTVKNHMQHSAQDHGGDPLLPLLTKGKYSSKM